MQRKMNKSFLLIFNVCATTALPTELHFLASATLISILVQVGFTIGKSNCETHETIKDATRSKKSTQQTSLNIKSNLKREDGEGEKSELQKSKVVF
jgi:hypothetical protein